MFILKNYVIITDSTTDLPPQLIKDLNIDVLPLTFTVNNKTYKNLPDWSELPLNEFYSFMRNGNIPSTSQINPDTFIESFTPYLESGKDILYIAFSSGLSGTFQSVNVAKQKLLGNYPDRKIVVVDSLCASMGEGLLVYYAAKFKDEGMDIDTLETWLNNNKLNLCHWFTVDDLHYLHKGGRVSSAVAIIGSMLNIKPILHVDDDGHLILMKKARGRQKSLDMLVSKIQEDGIDLENQIVFISHGDCKDEAQYVADNIKNKCNVKDVVINTIGPVIGSHSGPGTMAVFFMGKKR